MTSRRPGQGERWPRRPTSRARPHHRRRSLRHAFGWTGLVLVAFVAGCGNETTPNALDPKGEGASEAAVVWWALLGGALFVGIIIVGLIAWGSLRGPRDNPGRLRDNTFITLGGVVLPVIILVPVAVLTVVYTSMMRPAADDGDDVVRATVIGHQYWWEIRYPDLGIQTANELVVPVDRPVELTLRSADVIHSFWVPELAGKQDLVPGDTNRLRIKATEVGDYWGVCAEFCGEQHANMSFVVHARSDGGFDAWVDDLRTATQPTDPLAVRGRELFTKAACAGCHTIDGTDAQGDVGPDLTEIDSRATIGAGVLDNTDENLARWITQTQQVKPGAKMLSFPMSDEDIRAIVAYLGSDR